VNRRRASRMTDANDKTPEHDALRIADNPERSRYEVYVGSDLAGVTDYHAQPGLVTLMHTEIYPAFEGQGVGSRFVAGVLDDIRRRGTLVLPICPYVRAFLQRHPEYADLVAFT
jgi:predicted GNAT family acetyltransferase